MHEASNLLRTALESKKTVSRRKKTLSSQASSAVGSRAGSTAGSRPVSDDDDGYMSDSTTFSSFSVEDPLVDGEEGTTELCTRLIQDYTRNLRERKGSSVQGREESLGKYISLLQKRCMNSELEADASELIAVFLKSVKNEDSKVETVRALKAIAMTIVTCPSDTAFSVLYQPLNRCYTDSTSMEAKAAAIHTLGIATLYGGASDTTIEEIITSLSDIILSDGMEIGAHDSAAVVTAAIEQLSFLATFVDDFEPLTDEVLEGLIDQLSSTSAMVQLAAGAAIALVFEKSHSEREADDPACTLDPLSSTFHPLDAAYVQRYSIAGLTVHRLVSELTTLVRTSDKSTSRTSRSSVRARMLDVLNTVEHPGRGPGFRQARDDESGRHLGHGLKLKIPAPGGLTTTVVLKRWETWHRVQGLKRVLGPGFNVHYVQNSVVAETVG